MMNPKPFVDGAVAYLCWMVGFLGTLALFSGSETKTAYALIIAWWLTAYASSRLDLSSKAIPIVLTAHALLFLALAISGKNWLYHGATGLTVPAALFAAMAQGALVASPLIFDQFSRFLTTRICGKKQTP